MAITTINENDYIKDSRTVINDNFTELDTTKAPLNSPALTGTPTAPTPNHGDDSTKIATTAYVREELRQHASMPIGHEYFTMNPNIPQGSLPLFGGEYSRATYADLWAWVQEQTGYLKTESDWQDLSTAHNGNVPYYSDGDGSTTFRVPSLKCWVKGANGTVTEVGSYLEAGLPNITGTVGLEANIAVITANEDKVTVGDVSGAFTETKVNTTQYITSGGSVSTWEHYTKFNLDASRSNSIYGNSTTVQPESIVGLWLVKAYGAIVDTGTIDEQQYIDDRIAALPTSLSTTFLPLAGGEMSGAIKFGAFAGKILDFGGTGHGNLSLQEENGHQVIYFSANTNGGYPPEGAQLILQSVDGNGGYGNAIIRVGNDGSTCKDLSIKPSGSLTWGGKEVERVNASGSWYIRYESGVQICWGNISATTSGTTVTFGAAFKDTNYILVNQGAGYSINAGHRSKTTTSVIVESSASTAAAVNWIAIGWWK